MDGIENKIACPDSVDENLFSMSKKEREMRGIDNLPETLNEALYYMEKDSMVKEVLGKHTYEIYKACKQNEWDEYKTYVSSWELNRYMTIY